MRNQYEGPAFNDAVVKYCRGQLLHNKTMEWRHFEHYPGTLWEASGENFACADSLIVVFAHKYGWYNASRGLGEAFGRPATSWRNDFAIAFGETVDSFYAYAQELLLTTNHYVPIGFLNSANELKELGLCGTKPESPTPNGKTLVPKTAVPQVDMYAMHELLDGHVYNSFGDFVQDMQKLLVTTRVLK